MRCQWRSANECREWRSEPVNLRTCQRFCPLCFAHPLRGASGLAHATVGRVLHRAGVCPAHSLGISIECCSLLLQDWSLRGAVPNCLGASFRSVRARKEHNLSNCPLHFRLRWDWTRCFNPLVGAATFAALPSPLHSPSFKEAGERERLAPCPCVCPWMRTWSHWTVMPFLTVTVGVAPQPAPLLRRGSSLQCRAVGMTPPRISASSTLPLRLIHRLTMQRRRRGWIRGHRPHRAGTFSAPSPRGGVETDTRQGLLRLTRVALPFVTLPL